MEVVGPMAATFGLEEDEESNVKYFSKCGSTKSAEDGAKNTIHQFEDSVKHGLSLFQRYGAKSSNQSEVDF